MSSNYVFRNDMLYFSVVNELNVSKSVNVSLFVDNVWAIDVEFNHIKGIQYHKWKLPDRDYCDGSTLVFIKSSVSEEFISDSFAFVEQLKPEFRIQKTHKVDDNSIHFFQDIINTSSSTKDNC